MKFRCERDVLVDALGTAGRAVSTRGGAYPVLSGVRLEVDGDRLRLVGSDLELTIEVAIDVSGGGDGVVVAPARLLTDIVKALEPGAVAVERTDEEVHIASGRSQFAVRVLSADDFPATTAVESEELVLSAGDLSTALHQVVRAASRDEMRAVLMGVLLASEGSGLRLVATDSYRLAVRDLPGTVVLAEGQSVLVPSQALAELARLLPDVEEVGLRLGERDAVLRAGRATITTRLIEGEFPNYQQLIPATAPNRLTVGKEPLLDAVKRVRLMAREQGPVRLSMSADRLELSAVSQDVGEAHEDLDAKYEGEALTVAFNPEYLVDGVEAAGGDEVVIETVDALKPATVRANEASDYLYLLMPVRVS